MNVFITFYTLAALMVTQLSTSILCGVAYLALAYFVPATQTALAWLLIINAIWTFGLQMMTKDNGPAQDPMGASIKATLFSVTLTIAYFLLFPLPFRVTC